MQFIHQTNGDIIGCNEFSLLTAFETEAKKENTKIQSCQRIAVEGGYAIYTEFENGTVYSQIS